MELRVHYTGGLNVELDKAIREALNPFGLHDCDSGMDLTTGIRDLAFDEENEDEPAA
jgi:hypothetical protein